MLNYRLIGPPRTWLISLLFQNAPEDSIHGKIYSNNMDGTNSFYDTKTGLDYLVNNKSLALLVETPIHSYKEYHCQVFINVQIRCTKGQIQGGLFLNHISQ